MITRTKPLMNPHRPQEPAVQQPPCNGWAISWNPDTRRWHVDNPVTDETVADFAERRNALAYARKHPAPVAGRIGGMSHDA